MLATICSILLLGVPVAVAQKATLTVSNTDNTGLFTIKFDCDSTTQSLVFGVFNGTTPIDVKSVNPVYFSGDFEGNQVTLFAEKDPLPSHYGESVASIVVDSEWAKHPLCLQYVEAKAVSGSALVTVDVEVKCASGAFVIPPSPPTPPVSNVNKKLSCNAVCGDRATNGKDQADPDYQYCLCSNNCASGVPIFTQNCCSDFNDQCSQPSGSCQVSSDGVTSNLCGTYNDNDLCDCSPNCVNNADGPCCPDYTAVCLNGLTPPPPHSCADSCSAVDETYVGQDCFCDLWCTNFGDCCPDYTDACGKFTSCVGFCDDVIDGQGLCECDALCTAYNDCCGDYTDACTVGGLGEGEKAGTPSCTPADCGTCNLGECCCEPYCTFFGDCCVGYNSVCTTGGKPLDYPPPPPTASLPGNSDKQPITIGQLPFVYAGTLRDYTADNPDLGSVVAKCNGATVTSADMFFLVDVSSGTEQTLVLKLTINSDTNIYTGAGDFMGAISIYPIGEDGVDYTTDLNSEGPSCTADQERGFPIAQDSFLAQAQTVYMVVVSGFAKGSASGPVSLGEFSLHVGTVAGDRMENPIVIDTLANGKIADYPSTTLGYTDTFEPEAGEPAKCATPAGSSDVWFMYTPIQEETVKITLCTIETDYKAVLHVLKHSGSNLEHTVCDVTASQADESCKGYSLTMSVTLEQSQELSYYFVVETKKSTLLGGSTPASGDFRLSLSSIIGDTASNPIAILEVPTKITGTTEGFTNTTSPPATEGCDVGTDAPDVFYKYVAKDARDIVIRLCFDNGLDAVLYTYKVDPTTKLPVDATAQCNDDSVDEGCGLGSSVVLSVTQGQEYFIVVDAKKDQTGTYTLFIDYAECDNVAYPCAIELPYSKELNMADHANSVSPPSACGDASTLDGVDLVLQYTAEDSTEVTMEVCSYFQIIPYILKGSKAELDLCFDVENDDCVKKYCIDYLLSVVQGTTYYIVFEGKPFTSKEDGVVVVGDSLKDYAFSVNIYEGHNGVIPGDYSIGCSDNPTKPNDDSSDDDSGSNAGAIVGILFGVLAGVGLLVGGFFFLKSRGYSIPLLSNFQGKSKGLGDVDDMAGAGSYEALNMD